MHPSMSTLSGLPVSERIELVQDLWDSISASRHEMPVQQWQRELALARLADLDSGDSSMELTEDQVWQQVDERRGAIAQ
jgi:putative addiction module component (TIGR02574 family)